MLRAEDSDKTRVAEILASSFADNKSVNYIIKQDDRRGLRLRRLMEYSFNICFLFGDVFLSEDKTACALIIYPDKKKTTLKSILLDAKLALSCMGLGNLKKAMNREAKIKKVHPEGLLCYLWFIGVFPTNQNKGIGSQLLKDVIAEGQKQNRIICLETSTIKNIPWYEKFDFTTYKELDFGYKLYCMKRV